MGLDMYLSRKVHLPNYKHAPGAQEICKGVMQALKIENPERYSNGSFMIELPEIYWRKANAIHGWFVREVQNGNDDCGNYEVSKEALQRLADLCQKVTSRELGPEALPPTEGFFFGSNQIDDGYWEDLQMTYDALKKALEMPNVGGDESMNWFEYHSSW